MTSRTKPDLGPPPSYQDVISGKVPTLADRPTDLSSQTICNESFTTLTTTTTTSAQTSQQSQPISVSTSEIYSVPLSTTHIASERTHRRSTSMQSRTGVWDPPVTWDLTHERRKRMIVSLSACIILTLFVMMLRFVIVAS